ncbi:MAG: PaaI family thioesterase [Bacteroidaceae bacterium]|nr:PaaI family thioesterase [Bacteroidaceae bacterium]
MTIKEFFKKDRFAALIGAELIEAGEGYAKARMKVEERHLNGGDICQGGALFTLADLAFAAAVNSHGTLTFAITSSITYVRSARLGEIVYAEAHEVVNHHSVPFCEVKVTDESGNLVAIFTGSGYRKKNAQPLNIGLS